MPEICRSWLGGFYIYSAQRLSVTLFGTAGNWPCSVSAFNKGRLQIFLSMGEGDSGFSVFQSILAAAFKISFLRSYPERTDCHSEMGWAQASGWWAAGASGFHFSLFSLFFPTSIFYYYFLSIPLGMKRKRKQISLQLLLRRPSIQVQIHRDEKNCGQERRKEIFNFSLLLVGPVALWLHNFSPLLTSPDLLKLDLSSSLKKHLPPAWPFTSEMFLSEHPPPHLLPTSSSSWGTGGLMPLPHQHLLVQTEHVVHPGSSAGEGHSWFMLICWGKISFVFLTSMCSRYHTRNFPKPSSSLYFSAWWSAWWGGWKYMGETNGEEQAGPLEEVTEKLCIRT